MIGGKVAWGLEFNGAIGGLACLVVAAQARTCRRSEASFDAAMVFFCLKFRDAAREFLLQAVQVRHRHPAWMMDKARGSCLHSA